MTKKSESFKYYTDGNKTIKVYSGDSPPDGFYPGRTFKTNPWNKGLTANTDERVKTNTQKCHETRKKNNSYVPWNKGLTKETDPRLLDIARKVSISTKGRIPYNKGIPKSQEERLKLSQSMIGRVPYNKGLTKENCDSLLQTSIKLKGHKCFVTDWEKAKQKEYETKKKNGTFNSSKPEERLINDLKNQYGENNVVSQYRDDRYPFNCDAYIKSEDLFIEYNGTVEHHNHPFDINNCDDIKEANRIRELAISKGPNSRYWNILKWWTDIDPKKLNTFRNNNLNFIIIYPNGLIINK